MTLIKPFRALRPRPELAERVACVPYDVASDDEVLEFIRENPLSFLRVTRPEAELTAEERSRPVYAFEQARESLRTMIDDGVLITDDEPSIYVYRLSNDIHRQTGVVACCSLDEYENGSIRKHEKTRPDKVLDRTGHLLTLRAQTGLILLAYRGKDPINDLTEQASAAEPIYSFRASDGIEHSIWKVSNIEPWIEAFNEVPMLYIADGHHRIESANVSRRRIISSETALPSGDEYNYVMAGIFPAEQLQILAYNRTVSDLAGKTHAEILDGVREYFHVSEADTSKPAEHGEICMYLGGKWYDLRFSVNYYREPDPIERLDVTILQKYILEPVLGIADPRRDKRIGFVGGGRGIDEFEKLVDSGKAAVAFSLYPTTIDDLFAVSDMGEIMPPKSTWFEPKLKDGLLIHQI